VKRGVFIGAEFDGVESTVVTTTFLDTMKTRNFHFSALSRGDELILFLEPLLSEKRDIWWENLKVGRHLKGLSVHLEVFFEWELFDEYCYKTFTTYSFPADDKRENESEAMHLHRLLNIFDGLMGDGGWDDA